MWRQIDKVASTGSTNADVRMRANEPEGLVLVADEQTAGRGRLGRVWATPAGSGVAVSVLLRPDAVAPGLWGWLPLLVGIAAADAVRQVSDCTARLKWPNDIVVDDRKLGGILVERIDAPAGPAAVAGLGLNVSLLRGQLPVPTATSLLIETGAAIDREALIDAYLRQLMTTYRQWCSGTSLHAAYRAVSTTIGRRVSIALPDRTGLSGEAVDVDELGRLVVRADDDDVVHVSAGDVQHLR